MNFEALKSKLIEELVGGHGCHTVILYGSRARGDFTEQSDIDVLGIRQSGEAFRIGRPWCGTLTQPKGGQVVTCRAVKY